ncbi:MAG: DedA family protein [Planctomycetes bacterium]|nr:DedA family protein [Planctomycetota bacterium]
MMELIRDLFLNLDDFLKGVIAEYGVWTYAILFIVIFAETGLVVTPFLPGDSLLFAAGIFAGDHLLSPFILFVLLTAAAILGDAVNYSIGKMIGPRVLKRENSRIFKKEYLAKTHAFYEKYGGKTIIIARFVPIVRTFAPFVAGVGTMTYARFFAYNVIGAVLWVAICLLAGYTLGGFEVVKKNFEIAVLLIIFVSVLPMAIEFLKARAEKKRAIAEAAAAAPTDV